MKDYQRMEEMKMEYEQIPVPQELRGRVQESLAWAKEKEHKKLRFCRRLGRIAGTVAAAMAGTNSYIKIYHIDKQSGKIVTLRDIFEEGADYITPISENIKSQMKERMAQDEEQYYWLDEDTEAWNFENISPEANFYVNQEGKLTLVFDKYEVAPGYMGVVEFTIPTEILEPIVRSGYLK